MASLTGAKRKSDSQHLALQQAKRPRSTTEQAHEDDTAVRLRHEDYRVGWICALPVELAATTAMLDQIHESLPRDPLDSNAYTLGSIGPHNIAIACLPKDHFGLNNAAIVGGNMRRTFPGIDTRLMVGIGGGIPESVNIRLGDIVVGTQVVQFDFGKAQVDGLFQRTALPTRPPQSLMTAVSTLQAAHYMRPSRVSSFISEALKRHPSMTTFGKPEYADRLFQSSYSHDPAKDDCESCHEFQLVRPTKRDNNDPLIHYGKIASGNQVVKDASVRAKLARELGAICVKMEAAGLTDGWPCLVIRGICDYADSHKTKQWQPYSAAVAAAYAKELLLQMPETQEGPIPIASSNDAPEPPSLEERRARLLESLDFDEKDSRHTSIKPAYTKTCEWFRTHHSYTTWQDPAELPNHHGFLWISGKPGAGKSTLMKFAFDHVTAASKSIDDNAAVSFFFHARGDILEKSTAGMYRSLVLQIFKRFPALQEVLDGYLPPAQARHDIGTWRVDILQSVFSDLVKELKHRTLICFIDALDECQEEEVRDMVQFFEELGERAFLGGTKFYSCLSSRHYPHISIEKCYRFTLENQDEHEKDIEKYVRGKLKAGKSKAASEVYAEILRKSAGVFLWVILAVDVLNRTFQRGRIWEVKQRLEALPPGLSDLFKDIICRDKHNMDDLLLCIQWILFSKRPLFLQEYYFALSVGLASQAQLKAGWDPEYITHEYMMRFVLSSSKGLAEITKSTKKPTVQFIHESVRDFLIKDNGIRELWPELADGFEGLSHDQLKRCCHAYIQLFIREVMGMPEEITDPSSKETKDLRASTLGKFPLLEYAVTFIFHHANMAASRKISQQFFMENVDFPSWIQLFNLYQRFKIRMYGAKTSPAYILAELDYPELLKMPPYHECAFQASAGRYKYPFLAVVANGNKELACSLLSLANIQHAELFNQVAMELGPGSGRSSTPLHWAAHFGHVAICSAFLDLNLFELNSRTTDGQTAVFLAARNGCADALTMLVSRDGVDLSIADKHRETPLLAAARNGHASCIKQLLTAAAIDVNHQGRGDCTALSLAFEKDHLSCVELLLESGKADLDLKDAKKWSPIMWITYKGHVNFVKRFLESKGIAIGQANLTSNPFYLTPTNGHECIANILLEVHALDFSSEIKSDLWQALLHAAVSHGYAAILRLIFAKANVNLSSTSPSGHTPLTEAARGGHSSVVELLLRIGRADVNTKNLFGRSPLTEAAGHGHSHIVELLLDTGKADVSASGSRACTPLARAARHGHSDIVELLLRTGQANINGWNKSCDPPLTEAAHGGHCDTVTILPSAEGVDINVKNKFGRTPLAEAARAGHINVVKILLGTGKADINARSVLGVTPLGEALAAHYHQKHLVDLLTDNGAHL